MDRKATSKLVKGAVFAYRPQAAQDRGGILGRALTPAALLRRRNRSDALVSEAGQLPTRSDEMRSLRVTIKTLQHFMLTLIWLLHNDNQCS